MYEEEGLPEHNVAVTSPSSVVGCDPRSAPQPTINNSEERWKLLFEQQNQNFLALINAMKRPTTSGRVCLPTFDPEKTSVDARAWLSTADMCMADQPLSGASLMIALSEALKGQASAWLAQVSFPGMTWKDFQEAFTARYDVSETAASTLINLYNSKPKEGECLANYAATQLNNLMSRWKNLSTEQIAISTVMTHIAQIEPRVNRVAFTTEIENRTKMQQELKALSYMKRKAPTSDYNNDSPDPKQRKLISTPVKCAHCGRLGHHISACRLRKDNRSTETSHAEAIKSAATSKLPTTDITCYNCRGVGHYASRCPRAAITEAKMTAVSTTSKPVERRVDVCAVGAPLGILEHFGSSRANGQVERVMSTLKNMLTAVEASGEKSWQEALPEVQLALNCTINRVTKSGPLDLFIGKVARPLELMWANDHEPQVDIDTMREQAITNMDKNSQYDKVRFNSTKAKVQNFNVGDFVLLQNEERNQCKLDPKFKGPFRVIEVLDGDRYVLKALNGNRTYKYAHYRLRKMPSSEIPEDLSEDNLL